MHENGRSGRAGCFWATEKQPAPYPPFQNKENFMGYYENISFIGITNQQTLNDAVEQASVG
nr:hypothetical protein [uncultured Kingella sp.]